jgi:hypothetical protein
LTLTLQGPMQRSRLHTSLSGVSGEYFVAAELTRRGYVASLTLKNTQGIDVLASSVDGRRQVTIQVKTEQGSGSEWVLSAKADKAVNSTLFYIFVRLHDLGVPTYHIVPSEKVAEFSKQGHERWLSEPGRRGRPHKNSSMRKFRDTANEFLGRWDLLGLEPSAS